MVKSYLKFELAESFGVVASGSSNILWTAAERGAGAGRAVVAANERVLCWDIKKGELLSTWSDKKCTALVSAIAQSRADPDLFAVGYEDGSVRLWDRKISTVMVTFNGHRSAITHLAFDRAGVRLASGSKDTDVIVWDLVAEVGLFKLRGHKDQITGLVFLELRPRVDEEEAAVPMVLDMSSDGFMLTSSKDSLIKLWDLSSRHCIETHVAQTNGECWALGVSPDYSGCITAGNDGELKFWALDSAALARLSGGLDPSKGAQFLQDRGTLQRQRKEKATEISFHPSRDYFLVHGSEKFVEVWRIRPETEVRKVLARKKRRWREKQSALEKKNGTFEPLNADSAVEKSDVISAVDLSDVFVHHVNLRTGGKARSADWIPNSPRKEIQILVGTTTNQIELYSITARDPIQAKSEAPDYSRVVVVDLPGHRTDVRTMSLSSDDKMLATAANGSLKVWNIRTHACIRTFECGYALCCSFLPGDKVIVVGTKAGELQLFDVASAALIETVVAHEGAVWSLQVHPDGRSVVTGSTDKTAKFWNFKIIQEQIPGANNTIPRLTLAHARTLKVADDILCVKFSPDARLLAVALIDSTVKVFFVDSLKLYLNLYGHKLPVLCMDISFDSKLIITGSADKNIKIWGLDFGDCHKSLFGHQDSILQVAFISHNSRGSGHHFFSASKDRDVKYWDGSKFEQVQRLRGHHGEIWAMVVSHGGQFLVTAGHDKSIRVWRETDEEIFLEEEREKELEELYEQTLATSLDKEADVEARAEGGEVGPASKPTTESSLAGERLAEALELGLADLILLRQWEEQRQGNPRIPPPQRDMVFLAMNNISAEAHVMNALQRIKASALQDALLILPFAKIPILFTFLDIFAARSMNVPLTCRVLFLMLRAHHAQIVASNAVRTLLDGIRNNLRRALKKQKDEMGVNLAALRVVGAQIQEKTVKNFVDDSWDDAAHADQQIKKRAFVHVA